MSFDRNRLVLSNCIAGSGVMTTDGLTHVKTLPFLSVVQSVAGRYEIALGDAKPVMTEEGGCFIAPPDVRQTIIHHLPASGGPMCCQWAFLDLTVDDLWSIDRIIRLPTTLSAADSLKTGRLIRELSGLREGSLGCEITRQRIGFEIFEELFRFSGTVPGVFPGAIQAAVNLMEQHLSSALTNRALAESCGLSESRFCHLFREMTRLSPMRYFMKRRLSCACLLLISTDRPVGDIAAATGFYDQFHFSRAFKKAFGTGPLAYRSSFAAQYGAGRP